MKTSTKSTKAKLTKEDLIKISNHLGLRLDHIRDSDTKGQAEGRSDEYKEIYELCRKISKVLINE